MLLKLENGTEYHVRFQHAQNPLMTGCYTRAGISDSTGFIIREGRAFCNPSDQFNKAKGRKLSLARAIECLPRAERKQIWAAYFAAIGGIR